MPRSSADHNNSYLSRLSRYVTVDPSAFLAGAEPQSEVGLQKSLKLVLVGWTLGRTRNRLNA